MKCKKCLTVIKKALRLLDCYRGKLKYKIEVYQSISIFSIFSVRKYLDEELKKMTFKKWFGCKKSVADDVTKQNISTRVAENTNELLTLNNFKQFSNDLNINDIYTN